MQNPFAPQKGEKIHLRAMQFKSRPTLYNFKDKQASKVVIRSEEDKMLAMDLCLRGNDDVKLTSNPLNRIRYTFSGIG